MRNPTGKKIKIEGSIFESLADLRIEGTDKTINVEFGLN
jgi:hypothetical protein